MILLQNLSVRTPDQMGNLDIDDGVLSAMRLLVMLAIQRNTGDIATSGSYSLF